MFFIVYLSVYVFQFFFYICWGIASKPRLPKKAGSVSVGYSRAPGRALSLVRTSLCRYTGQTSSWAFWSWTVKRTVPHLGHRLRWGLYTFRVFVDADEWDVPIVL